MKQHLVVIAVLAAALLYCASQQKAGQTGAESAPPDSTADTAAIEPQGFEVSADAYAAYDKKAKEEALRKKNAPPPDTTMLNFESEDDEYESREIVVADTSPYARQIDSLDSIISLQKSQIFDNDKILAKMSDYETDEKISYMRYLLKTHKKDSSAILATASMLVNNFERERQKLFAILESQTGRNRSIVSLHIKALQTDMRMMGDFVLQITPEQTVEIEHGKPTKRTFE